MFGSYGFGQNYFAAGPLGNIEIIEAEPDVIILMLADMVTVRPISDDLRILVPPDNNEVIPT